MEKDGIIVCFKNLDLGLTKEQKKFVMYGTGPSDKPELNESRRINTFAPNFTAYHKEGRNTTSIVDNYSKEKFSIVCSKEDSYDKNIAVALGLAYRYFGSKTKFHKFVEKNFKEIKLEKEVKVKTNTKTSKKSKMKGE
jgi:hypothetical protein